ncbi:MAG: histidine kinase, partial [Burkholderiaceae bacterium]|nr:histidine kinase [Burkholderiaceae bacterium]
MQAQIEPHFLFNTLAGLRSLIVHDPPRAADLVDKLTDYLRATMPRTRASDGAALPALLGQQLDAAESYLGLMRLRIGERRLGFDVRCETGLRERPFAPLM